MATPAKRVLQETTNIHLSPQDSIKKRKLDVPRQFVKGDENKILSSQPKSSFEEHLEQLSQNISGLKQNNAERDQKWARPSLDGFKPELDDVTFQQIDVEEGSVHNKQAIRLFGVSEVSSLHNILPCPF
jgi:DNA polymerase delta subunit 1